MIDDPLEIREEQRRDIAAIREVIRRAFGQADEGRIIDALRPEFSTET